MIIGTFLNAVAAVDVLNNDVKLVKTQTVNFA